MKQRIPQIITVLIGLTTLFIIAFDLSLQYLLDWAAFMAALAFLAGITNLTRVHVQRITRQRAIPSLFLVVGLILTLLVGVLGNVAGVSIENIFTWVLYPLEAALASMMAFFLFFALIRLAQRKLTIWTGLFLLTAVFFILTPVLINFRPLPSTISQTILQIQTWINNTIVTAGMRGLLIGIALATIMLSLRLLVGLEKPYNKS